MTVDKELLAGIASVVTEDKQLPDNNLFPDKDDVPESRELHVKAKEAEPEPTEVDEPENTEEQSPAEEVKAEESEESESDSFSAELKQRAIDIGLSEEDVKIFPSAEALDKALILMEKRGMAFQKKQEEAPPAMAPAVKKEEQSSENTAEDPIPDLDPEVFDEKLVEVWKGLKGVNKKQSEVIEALKGQIASISAQLQSTARDRTLDQVEDFFKGLGAEYVPFIGEGRGTSLKMESVEMQSRIEILEVAETLMANYARQNKQVPFNTALERATHAILGDKLRSLESGKIASRLEKRSNAILPRPRGQNEKARVSNVAPETMAEAAVKKILEKAQK